MYEIRKNGVILTLTDFPNYIRIDPAGFYYLCEPSEAQGVAVNGIPYALTEGALGERETVTLVKLDSGRLMTMLQAQSDNIAKLSGQTAAAAKVTMQDSTTVTDEQALLMPDMFRTWEEALKAGKALVAETVINKDGILYRVVQGNTPMEHQPPDGEGMLALYRPIVPGHSGTMDDPIPWIYGMDCKMGLYYDHGGKVYFCAGSMTPCIWAPDSGIWQWKIPEQG